jgi:hypothetical protein
MYRKTNTTPCTYTQKHKCPESHLDIEGGTQGKCPFRLNAYRLQDQTYTLPSLSQFAYFISNTPTSSHIHTGEKITAEEARGERGLSVELVEQLARSGVQMDAELLQMLQEARQLRHTAHVAEAQAMNEHRGQHGPTVDHEGEWQSAAPRDYDDSDQNVALTTHTSAHAGGASTGGAHAQGQAARRDHLQGENDAENVGQARHSAKPRVLAVMPPHTLVLFCQNL